MSLLLDQRLEDLRDRSAVIEFVLGELRGAEWSVETPAVGWTVGDQVKYLADFDEAVVLASLDESVFFLHARDRYGVDNNPAADGVGRGRGAVRPVRPERANWAVVMTSGQAVHSGLASDVAPSQHEM